MAKLTISVDPRVVRQAKTYARAASKERDTPVLRELRGILRGVDPRSYRGYLRKKYR